MMSSEREISSPSRSRTFGNDEPFSLSKFLTPSMEGNEASLFLSWLQNRIREYYLKLDEHRRRAIEIHEFGPVLSMDELDICFSELKLIAIDEESHWMKTHCTAEEESSPPTHTHDDGCVVKGIQCKFDENLPYETGIRKFAVSFQKAGMTSPVETLHLVLEVGEVHDVGVLEAIIPPFIAYSEKHSIQMFNLLFPTLQGWLYAKNSEFVLPIPTCYYSRYEENNKIDTEKLLEQQDAGILAQIASALESEKPSTAVESHRILILNNVLRHGFKPKNAAGTSFLSLMNVTFGVKEIAKLHAVSWAFSKNTRKPLHQHFPFLEMANFLPYFKSLLATGFPILTTLSEIYLEKQKSQDKDQLLERMQFIYKNLVEIVSKLYPPKAISFSSSGERCPVTLLHQGLNYTTTLFRHSYHTKQDVGKPLHHIDNLEPRTTSDSTSSPDILIQRELCLMDWKCATYGSPMFDVAFFLLTSLPPKTRQRETTSLLKLYAQEFSATASRLGHGEDITWNWDDLKEDYEKGLLYGSLLLSTNVTPEMVVTENDMEVFVEAMRDVISLQIL